MTNDLPPSIALPGDRPRLKLEELLANTQASAEVPGWNEMPEVGLEKIDAADVSAARDTESNR